MGGGRVPGWRSSPPRTSSTPGWPTGASSPSASTGASAPATPCPAPRSSRMPCARHPRRRLGDHLEAGLPGTHVDLRVATHADSGGIWVTADDVTLARRLSEVARRHSVVAVPGEVTQVELGLDTAARRQARAVLGGGAHRRRRTAWSPTPSSTRPASSPSIWFQGTEPHETPRQRWHLDLWVAPEVAAVAHRRRGGGRRHGRRRLRGAVVHGARRPRRQQGVRLHPPRPGLIGDGARSTSFRAVT